MKKVPLLLQILDRVSVFLSVSKVSLPLLLLLHFHAFLTPLHYSILLSLFSFLLLISCFLKRVEGSCW